MNQNENTNIECDVKECRYHSLNKDYCTLDSIKVTKHESTANCSECTDCSSFELK